MTLVEKTVVVLFNSSLADIIRDISPKVSIIAWLEFKFAYDDVTGQHISHYAMETPPETEIDR